MQPGMRLPALHPIPRAAALALAALVGCAGPPEPPAAAEMPPPVAAPTQVAAAPVAGPPRACRAIEAELGDSSEISGAAAGIARGAQAQMAVSVGTSVASTALGFVPVPGVAVVGGLVMQGVQTAQQAAMEAQMASMYGSVARLMERQERLMAEYRAAGCTGPDAADLDEG
jgi:hypothetical protein